MSASYFQRTAFKGWCLREGAKTVQPETLLGATLPDIERFIACAGNFGSTFLIVEHDRIEDVQTLHVYRIRRGKWAGLRDHDSLVKVYPYTADKLFALPVKSFDPVEPWRWVPSETVGSSILERQHS